MNQNYRNSLYSNSTESSRNGGGSWVYVNGELYHYGRPGMEWGKHLPGTDWWKEKISGIRSHFNSEYNARGANSTYQIGPSSYGDHYGTSSAGRRAKTRAALGATASTAKYIGQGLVKYAKRLPGHMVNEAKNIGLNIREDIKDARVKYSKKIAKELLPTLAKIFDTNYKTNKNSNLSGSTKLEQIINKEYNEAWESYQEAAEKGTAGRTMNSYIQNAQYSVVNGLNNFLKFLKIDDDVDKLINKFSKKK